MAASPQRGEVWWVDLDPARGSEIRKTRPCLVVTSDILNAHRRTVVVVPLSTSPRPNPPILVPVLSAGAPGVAVLDQLRAVAKERLVERMGVISQGELEVIEDGLREILEL